MTARTFAVAALVCLNFAGAARAEEPEAFAQETAGDIRQCETSDELGDDLGLLDGDGKSGSDTDYLLGDYEDAEVFQLLPVGGLETFGPENFLHSLTSTGEDVLALSSGRHVTERRYNTDGPVQAHAAPVRTPQETASRN